MSQPQTELTATERATQACQALGLSLKADFVPFSRSRNADQKHPSLNWKISLFKNATPEDEYPKKPPFMVTDYMQGFGHCPVNKTKFTLYNGKPDVRTKNAAILDECQTGIDQATRKRIQPPTIIDVVYSLLMDLDVLNSSGFEDWASDLGYDTDSRKAEGTYKACLEIGLKLQAVLGHKALETLREAFSDY